MHTRTLTALVAAAAGVLAASGANAQTVLNTSLQNINATRGAGVATTTTNANGTSTTTVGPGGDPNRVSGVPIAGTWVQTDVGGGGTAGITKTYLSNGNGAAYFAGTGPDSKANLSYAFAAPVALSALTSMSFDFIHDSPSTYSPVMRLTMTKDGVYAGQLVFEYTYQANPFQSSPANVWTTMSATQNSGIFWATNGALGPSQAAANGGEKDLADWLAGNAGHTLNVIGVNIGVGSGWPTAYSDAVDNVRFNFTGGPSGNFDFAVAGGAVPEPASWALMISGFGLAGAMLRRRRAVSATA